MKLTNNSAGARGVNLKDGTTVWLEPGESRDFDKAELAGTGAHADLTDTPADAPEKPLGKMSEAELRAAADADGIIIPEGAKAKDIVQLIETARAANA